MTLKVRRPFKYHGTRLGKGDLLSPEPEGRLRTALVDGGFAEEWHGNLVEADPPVLASEPETFTVDEPDDEISLDDPPSEPVKAENASKKSAPKASAKPRSRVPANAG